LECVGVERILLFNQNRRDRSAPNIFSGFGKHLFITTCIEKHCTGLQALALLNFAEAANLVKKLK